MTDWRPLVNSVENDPERSWFTTAPHSGTANSENIQVLRGDNLALVALPYLREQDVVHLLRHRPSGAIAAMIENEQAGLHRICDHSEFARGCMVPAAELLKIRRIVAEGVHRIDFVDQCVAAAAVLDECLRRRGIA